ncbi:MAG: flagellin [Alphaproteobacteria bacterium]
MTRVSDFAQHQLTLFYIQNTQNRLFDTQNQISTGYVAERYSGIGADSSRLVNLKSASNRIDQYLKNIQTVDQRLAQMETDTSTLFQVASKLQVLLVNGLNAETSSDLALNQQAQDLLNQVSGLLNDSLDGRHLFSGTATDTAPVDLNAAGFASPPTVYPGTADTGYYQGNSTKFGVQVDDNLSVTYGVTANEGGFEELIRALRLTTTANVGPPQDRARLEEALRVVKQAITDIPDITSRIGSARKALESMQAKHNEFTQFSDEAIGNIENVDVAQAITKLSEDQTTLQASYQVVSRLQGLSLADYLK